MKCIWCGKKSLSKDIEHIFPAALGCPDNLVLDGRMVCNRCNNKLSKLDLAVCDEFDLMAFFSGVPRRGGKPPHVLNRGNLIATIEANGPTISINMDPRPYQSHTRKQLGPFGGSQRNVIAKTTVQGNHATISGQATFGQGKKFVRGLIKIAFSSFTYHLGSQVALNKEFDPIRDFVLHGIGQRHVLVTKGDTRNFLLASYTPWISSDGNYCTAFRIADLEFFVDLSPHETSFHELRLKATDLFGLDRFFLLPSGGV
jgi:hypothetical protein